MHKDLRTRTRRFAKLVIELCRTLPTSVESRIIINQLIRSATSVSANYRAALRARSRVEFAAKLGLALEEADESLHWLELLKETGIVGANKIAPLINESNEIVAIFVAGLKKTKAS